MIRVLPKQTSEQIVKSQTHERKNNFPFDVVTELYIIYNYINLCQPFTYAWKLILLLAEW